MWFSLVSGTASAAMGNRSLNLTAAGIFRECAHLLRQQHANPFRVNAYLRAASTLEAMQEEVSDILDAKGIDGLVELPGIGRGLASAIEEIRRTGHSSQLARLQGAAAPEVLLQSIPGIGPSLAEQIHDSLHIDTLEELEVAANDGRLESLAGIGPRRVAGIRAAVAEVLGSGRRRRRPHNQPGVDLLLEVDEEYRDKAANDKLPKIAPRRFNPDHRAWLPILHTTRGDWHFTALFSNTARAHQLGRTGDWVVIYYHDSDHEEGQHTVVTETHGPRKGTRVVRGRESELL